MYSAAVLESGEHQAFGVPDIDYVHFSWDVAQAIAEPASQFLEECTRYAAFLGIYDDPALVERIYLTNPSNFIDT